MILVRIGKWLGAAAALGVLVTIFVVASACETSGASARGKRLQRMEKSPQWTGDGFGNRLTRVDGSVLELAKQWIFGGSEKQDPEEMPPVQMRTGEMFLTPPASGLRVTWLGHSTLLVEIDGRIILIDPVWGERTSPFSWVGPARFYPPPLPLAELPKLDAIVISHDHYDHLDHPTVLAMLGHDVKWIVPLGIGAHLEHWGIDAKQIVELDWWEETKIENLTVTCTPARHFSGRSITFGDQNATLWAGWAFTGPVHRTFYSGDTALHDEFLEIGKRLGPFDLTMMEAGAYNALWSDVHLGPEQAVRAHQLVRGKVMLPVHWGLFDLALHGWTEPIERILVAAQAAKVKVVMPRPGGSVEPSVEQTIDRWWPKQNWQTVDEAPAFSSSVEHLLQADAIVLDAAGLDAEKAPESEPAAQPAP